MKVRNLLARLSRYSITVHCACSVIQYKYLGRNSIILVIQSKCGTFSDLNSACSKMLVHVKIFQFQDML